MTSRELCRPFLKVAHLPRNKRQTVLVVGPTHKSVQRPIQRSPETIVPTRQIRHAKHGAGRRFLRSPDRTRIPSRAQDATSNVKWWARAEGSKTPLTTPAAPHDALVHKTGRNFARAQTSFLTMSSYNGDSDSEPDGSPTPSRPAYNSDIFASTGPAQSSTSARSTAGPARTKSGPPARAVAAPYHVSSAWTSKPALAPPSPARVVLERRRTPYAGSGPVALASASTRTAPTRVTSTPSLMDHIPSKLSFFTVRVTTDGVDREQFAELFHSCVHCGRCVFTATYENGHKLVCLAANR
ncbi:hypothetical protein EXIGLDRAFT_733210 [Exidia glandulosa HHB12029]|uniref:Uncharacterized protein n=1 Tax=Exidia glandulosa HHB12029 TaxID=1314781 RepID=A0A165BCZ6_EXIGL|nr:hypothetical protein EXIGLDRAFT_733210 [Exidia glandulosa HHB12029]